MKIGELFELILTLLIFLVIWVVPRIIAARAADKKRRAKTGGKSAAKASPKNASEAKQSWSKEIFSKMINNSFPDTGSGKLPESSALSPDIQTKPPVMEEAAEPVSVFEKEEEQTFLEEQRDFFKEPLSTLQPAPPRVRPARSGRTPLQKAIIWQELLEPPKALRREPFP